MEDKEIIEGNKLIAEFMGYKTDKGIVWVADNVTTAIDGWAKYHTSWDWIMPVVEKIESIKFKVIISDTYCGIYDARKKIIGEKFESTHIVTEPLLVNGEEKEGYIHSYTWTAKTKIQGVYIAINKFIQWYNQTT